MSTYAEPLVARALGIQKRNVAATRAARLEKGTDWLLENSVVVYTPAGLKKLCAALGLDSALVEAAKNSEGASAGPAEDAQDEGVAGQPEGISSRDAGASFCAPMGKHPIGSAEDFAPRAGADVSHETAGVRGPSPSSAAADVAAAAESLAKKSAPVWIEVTGIPGNTIVVHGRLEGKPVTVRVKNNATFVPGLWVQATPLNGGTFYAMFGNPPRWKGDRHGFTKPAAPAQPQQEEADDEQ